MEVGLLQAKNRGKVATADYRRSAAIRHRVRLPIARDARKMVAGRHARRSGHGGFQGVFDVVHFSFGGDRAMQRLLAFVTGCFLLASIDARALDLPVYTDGLQSGFEDYSYGGGTNLANGTPTHGGSAVSIAFTGNGSFNAMAFHHAPAFAAGAYSGLRLFIHGGAAGGQQLALILYRPDDTTTAPYLLPAATAGTWTQIDVSFATLGFHDAFNRIDLQTASGVQPVMYVDDVSLTGAGAGGPQPDSIFADSFEIEYLLAPQYDVAVGGNNGGALELFKRVPAPAPGAPRFVYAGSTELASTHSMNAVSIAPDGSLWAIHSLAGRLDRYNRNDVLSGPGLVASIAQTDLGTCGDGDVFDLAFFGTNAYVTRGFGGHQICRYTIAALNGGGTPAATLLGDNNVLSTPVGLAFDAQGMLWVGSYDNQTIVRMNPATGHVDKSITHATMAGSEGLAFDAFGSLWVGSNNSPTIAVYSAAQLAAVGLGATTAPLHHIDTGGTPHAGTPSGYVGGVAFDSRGQLWAGYEYSLSILGYSLVPTVGGGGVSGYAATALPPLVNATTDPGRAGIAFWPRPPTLHIH
jgi:sugar lactone lactonase YvrE